MEPWLFWTLIIVGYVAIIIVFGLLCWWIESTTENKKLKSIADTMENMCAIWPLAVIVLLFLCTPSLIKMLFMCLRRYIPKLWDWS